MNAAHRQRQAMNYYLRQKGSRQRLTSSWTTSMVRSEPAITLANSSVAEDFHLNHSYPPPRTAPGYLHTAPSSGKRAVFPVTKGKHFGHEADDWSPLGPNGTVGTAGSKGVTTADNNNNAIPLIQVTDCNANDSNNTALADGCNGAGRDEIRSPQTSALAAKPAGAPYTESETTAAATAAATTTKTATIVTPPPASYRVQLSQQQQQQQQQSSSSHQATAQHSCPGSVHFPPVDRPPRTAGYSTRTGRSTRSYTPRTSESRKRLTSASSLWPGDPRAISSVRRDRRNIDEMLATMKAGEETRRLIREASPSCSRNCSKPNIMAQLGRAYINLPDLLPEIEKARKRMAEEEAAERDLPAREHLPLTASAVKRRSLGRFELEVEEEATGAKNLPIYHIDYSSLREIGGTRRNSVLA